MSRGALRTLPKAEKSLKGSEQCRQGTQRDPAWENPAWENEGKIMQSSYSVGRSSLESKAQSPTVHSDRKRVATVITPECARGRRWSRASCHRRPQGRDSPTVGSTQSPTGSTEDGGDAKGRQAAVKSSVQHPGAPGTCFTSHGSPAHQARGDAV